MSEQKDLSVLLEAYGAKVSVWPRARRAGYFALVSSKAFRRDWRESKRLDQALTEQAGWSTFASVDVERGERRLLARMGILDVDRHTRAPIGGRFVASLAVASLCIGLLIGGFAGDAGLGQDLLASSSDTLWESVIDDALGSDLG